MEEGWKRQVAQVQVYEIPQVSIQLILNRECYHPEEAHTSTQMNFYKFTHWDLLKDTQTKNYRIGTNHNFGEQKAYRHGKGKGVNEVKCGEVLSPSCQTIRQIEPEN